MRWLWVIPDVRSFPSGGNVYNEQLTRALSDLGEVVIVVSVPEWKRKVMQTEPDWLVVDAIHLPELQNVHLDVLLPVMTRAMVLVHHLSSLDTEHVKDREQEQRTLSKFDAILVTSPFTKAYLEPLLPGIPIWVLPPARSKHSKPADLIQTAWHPYLLMVANLIPRKGILDYLKALATILPVLPFHLVIAGSPDLDADYAKQCHQFVKQQDQWMDRVHFTGAISHSEVLTWMEGAAMLISASRMETYGMAIQEATQSGVPVIAVDGGHVKNLLSGYSSGRVVGDVQALAAATKSWWSDERKLARQNSKDQVWTGWEDQAAQLIDWAER
ncbi:MAG: glycosyltransferase family 4 protein [Saprospiraceae bacterium]|nr:glycosyltransferase family 4 protein [Saprospiraceae bacterium]